MRRSLHRSSIWLFKVGQTDREVPSYDLRVAVCGVCLCACVNLKNMWRKMSITLRSHQFGIIKLVNVSNPWFYFRPVCNLQSVMHSNLIALCLGGLQCCHYGWGAPLSPVHACSGGRCGQSEEKCSEDDWTVWEARSAASPSHEDPQNSVRTHTQINSITRTLTAQPFGFLYSTF